jgi:hypothetical protein
VPTIEDIVAALLSDEISGAEAIADLHAIVKAGQAGLRDEFAKAALQALVTALPHIAHVKDTDGKPLTEESIANQSYHFADSMLQARQQ